MKTVILAGGFGTRISEESHLKPKPMIEIGDLPILVHIMKIYSSCGFKDFIVCAGYKQNVIKEYFSNFDVYTNDVQFDYKHNKKNFLTKPSFDWKVLISDTGLNTQTGGRIRRVKDYIKGERFLLTYGDAVGNININEVIESHIKSKKMATICIYNFAQSKGVVTVDGNGQVTSFREKANNDGDLINIGYMVIEPEVIDLISSDECNFEKEILPQLALKGQLNSYVHRGFWQCMDTLSEKKQLEKLYVSENCPWERKVK